MSVSKLGFFCELKVCDAQISVINDILSIFQQTLLFLFLFFLCFYVCIFLYFILINQFLFIFVVCIFFFN